MEAEIIEPRAPCAACEAARVCADVPPVFPELTLGQDAARLSLAFVEHTPQRGTDKEGDNMTHCEIGLRPSVF